MAFEPWPLKSTPRFACPFAAVREGEGRPALPEGSRVEPAFSALAKVKSLGSWGGVLGMVRVDLRSCFFFGGAEFGSFFFSPLRGLLSF